MEMYTAAVIAYKKALELNPTDFNSKYNLSVVYNNMVVKMNDIVNAIPYNETAKYDKAKLERNDFINSVLPFIEKTFNEQEEPLIKKILNNFYSITKQNDKIKK